MLLFSIDWLPLLELTAVVTVVIELADCLLVGVLDDEGRFSDICCFATLVVSMTRGVMALAGSIGGDMDLESLSIDAEGDDAVQELLVLVAVLLFMYK